MFIRKLEIRPRTSSDKRLKLMMFSVIAFGVLLAFFSLSPYFYPAVVLIFSANIFASIFQTLNNTAIQLLIPDKVRGRISSFLMMSFSLPLLGTAPNSAIAEAYGLSAIASAPTTFVPPPPTPATLEEQRSRVPVSKEVLLRSRPASLLRASGRHGGRIDLASLHRSMHRAWPRLPRAGP